MSERTILSKEQTSARLGNADWEAGTGESEQYEGQLGL